MITEWGTFVGGIVLGFVIGFGTVLIMLVLDDLKKNKKNK